MIFKLGATGVEMVTDCATELKLTLTQDGVVGVTIAAEIAPTVL